MKRSYAVTILCMALAAPALSAQQQPAPPKPGEHKMAGMEHAKGGNMAAMHSAMLKSQASAIRAAEAVEKGAGAKRMNLKVLRRNADRAQDALQANIKRMDDMESSATDEQKEHMKEVRNHENEALNHANELVGELKKTDPAAAAVEEHAKAVVEHARAAESVMGTHARAEEKGKGKGKM